MFDRYLGIFQNYKSFQHFNKNLKNFEFCIFNYKEKSITKYKTDIHEQHKKIFSNIDNNQLKSTIKKDIKSEYSEILNELNDTIDKLVKLRNNLKKIDI